MSDKARDVTVLSGKVAPDWLERGVWFSKAALHFGDPTFADKARAAAERFAGLRDGETPEMYEYSSLLTGGTERDRQLLNLLYGDQKKTWLDYYTNRDAAQRDLEFKLALGSLHAFGAKAIDEGPVWIPTEAWSRLRRDSTEKDVVRGEGAVYWYVRIVDQRSSEMLGRSDVGRPPLPPPAYTAGLHRRKTGRAPDKKNAAEAAMISAVESGPLTVGQLNNIPKKQLPARFFRDASPTTCFEARRAAVQHLLADGLSQDGPPSSPNSDQLRPTPTKD